MKGGPAWSDVVARVTADAVSGEILDSELARDITRSLEHTPLEGGPRYTQTILIFETSKVKSPSPILQDSVRRGGVRGYGIYNDWNSRDKNCKLQESVNQQKVDCSNNVEGNSKVFQACAMGIGRRVACFENRAEWRMCLVLVQRLSRSVALRSACSARWRCCLSYPYFLTHCDVMSCVCSQCRRFVCD